MEKNTETKVKFKKNVLHMQIFTHIEVVNIKKYFKVVNFSKKVSNLVLKSLKTPTDLFLGYCYFHAEVEIRSSQLGAIGT